jgi:hypothetical protein
MALGSIFLSYRRSDSAGESGRLSDDLVARFGAGHVFMDVDAIQPGRDFRKAIRENVGGCSVLLAILGPDWLDVKSPGGERRLDNENDYVRLEIATALGRDIPVVPVLVRGARMPKAEQLPEDIRDLAYRNSVELTHARWKSDVQVLGHALAQFVECDGDAARVGQKPDEAAKIGTAKIEAAKTVVPVTPSGTFAPTDVERIGHQLACYIGPIAELVVKRAAKRSTSLPELCQAVAQEIESSTDRARFLASCRQ